MMPVQKNVARLEWPFFWTEAVILIKPTGVRVGILTFSYKIKREDVGTIKKLSRTTVIK